MDKKNKFKLALVNPFWSFKKVYPPTNLAQLAAFIRKNEIEVSILDLNYELAKSKVHNLNFLIDNSIEMIEKESPLMIGITCDTIHLPFCLEFIPKFKKKNPNIRIVLGGNHASLSPEVMFKLMPIDFIIVGEGELTLTALIKNLDQQKTYSEIDGLVYKNEKGEIIKNKTRRLIEDLSILPLPAYDLLPDLKSYLVKPDAEMGVSASRGCPNVCSFCSSNIFWGCQRFRPVENIISEIKYLIQEYGIKKISLDDLCLTTNKKWLYELLDKLKPLNLKLRGFVRIDHVNKELIEKMKNAGFYRLYHGIESGSERLRALLKKDIDNKLSNEEIIHAVNFEKETGIQPVCSFMTGIPTETEEDFNQTINLAYKLKSIGSEIQLWIMTPYPGIKAIKEYPEKIIKSNRWDILRQSDIFEMEQRILFRNSLERLKDINPDNFMFKPDIALDRFFELYKTAVKKLGLEKCERYLLIKPPIEEVVSTVKNIPVYNENPYSFFAYASQPSGLLKIASYLKSRGKEVSLIDCAEDSDKHNRNSVYNVKLLGYKRTGDGQKKYPLYHCGMSYPDFKKKLTLQKKPDEIYVTSGMTYHWKTIHNIINICKEVYPDINVTLGGIYATLCPKHAAKSKADLIFCGEFKEASNFDSDLTILKSAPEYAIIKSTRGCPNKCSYCAVHLLEGNKMAFRSHEDTYREIEKKYNQGIKKFIFWESNLLINCKNHFEKILEQVIENKLDIQLWAPEGLQPNLVTLELAKKMKKAGFVEVHVPLESSDKEMEKRFGRASNVKDFRKAVRLLKQAGFERKDIIAFILVGMPYQKLEGVLDSFITVWESGCLPKIMPFTPIPGTREFNNYQDILNNRSYEDLHPLLWPFAGFDLTTEELEKIGSFHRLENPIGYFKNNPVNSEIDKKMVALLKKSRKIWEEYYFKNLNTLIWNKQDIPDTIVMDFVKGNNRRNKKVLDIGCGTGKNSLFLEKEGYEVHGIDISETAIKNLNPRIKNKQNFVQRDILNLNYPKNSFDILLDVGCFHMINREDWNKYLENIERILKKEGLFVLRCFSEYGYNCSRFFTDEYKQGIKSPFLNFTAEKEIKELFGEHFLIKKLKKTFWSILPEEPKLVPGMYEIIMEKK